MTILSKGVALASSITKSLGMQVQVTLNSYTGDGGKGDPTYSSKKYWAVVSYKQQQIRTFSGELGVSNATVLFLDPATVKEFDTVTLPNGSGGPFIGVGGPVDLTGQLIVEGYL